MVAIDHKSFSKQKNVLLEKNHVGDFVSVDELTFYDINGTKYYPLQGSNMNIEAVIDASGNIVERYEVGAFGEVKILVPDGTERASTAVDNNHYFQGRYSDSESGFIYFRNCWMSAELGRIISRDPIRFSEGTDPINLYRFVNNNAYNFTDPTGMIINGNYDLNSELLVLSGYDKNYNLSAQSGEKQVCVGFNCSGGYAPIPAGRYYITEHWKPRVGWYMLINTATRQKDFDTFKDEYDVGNGQSRGEFRLHQYVNVSKGCVSARADDDDWEAISNWIENTSTFTIKVIDTKGNPISRKTYGTLWVN